MCWTRPRVSSSPGAGPGFFSGIMRSEEHTSELQSHSDLVCRLLLEKKKKKRLTTDPPRVTHTRTPEKSTHKRDTTRTSTSRSRSIATDWDDDDASPASELWPTLHVS